MLARSRISSIAGAAATVIALTGVSAAGSPGDTAPPGDLLIINDSFESGTTGWTFGHAPSPKPDAQCHASIITGQHHTGAASLELKAAAGCPWPAASATPVPVLAGERYTGYAQVRAAGDGVATARLRLLFLDAHGGVVGQAVGATVAAEATWNPVSAAGTAPPRSASVVVQPSGDDIDVDDVLLTARLTNLGAQIAKVSINAVTFGLDGQGRVTGYGVVTGASDYDAHLIGVDAATGDLTVNLPLPGATGAWAATTATDGSIYVGSYNFDDTTKNGRLYRYTPGADAVVDLGNPIAGDTFVWSITPGPDGSVYGGGYPSGGAFRYTPDGGYTQVGDRPLIAPEQYARSVAYDPSNDIVYVGIGAHAHLMACPGGGSTCTDILPAQYGAEEFAYSVSAGSGYVFANMSPSGDGHLVVLKVDKSADGSLSASVVADIPKVKYPGASTVIDGGVYLVANSKLSRFDLATGTLTSLGRGLPVAPRAWAADPTGGPALLTMGNSNTGPTLVRYDIDAATLTSVNAPDAPATPTDLQSLQTGPDGRIYSSGFLGGGTGVYTPMRSDANAQYSGVPQAEGSTVDGDTLYWGAYPGANIYAYRPSQPWKSGTNPKRVCSLTSLDQDRPYGMTAGGGKVYIGTEAGYGKLAGALSVYDPATGQCTTTTNIVPDETIASLAYQDGIVYGGTSIWGGLGIDPSQSEAVLLIYDTTTGTARTVALPTPRLRTVLGVTVGPDHRIWMVAEDHILVYDPATGRFVADQRIFPELNIPGTDLIDAHDAFLLAGRDGNLYGTIHDSYLFRIDPHTMQVTILVRGKVHSLVADGYGNLYYVQNGYELHRLAL